MYSLGKGNSTADKGGQIPSITPQALKKSFVKTYYMFRPIGCSSNWVPFFINVFSHTGFASTNADSPLL